MRNLLLFAVLALALPQTASARFTDFSFNRAGTNFCGLLESGHALCTSGSIDSTFLMPDPEQTFTAIELGNFYACGITSQGGIECFGRGGEGQLSPPEFDAPVVKLSVGAYHACAIDSDSNLKCWGQNVHGQTEPPQPTSGFRDVVARSLFDSCGVRDSGELVCWGRGLTPQFPPGLDDASLSPIAQISANDISGCVIREDGTADCWERITSQGETNVVTVAEFRDGPYERAFPLAAGDTRPYCAVTLNGELDCADGPYARGPSNFAPLPLGITRDTQLHQLLRSNGLFVHGLTFDDRIEAVNISLGSVLQRHLDIINGELTLDTVTLNDAQYYGAALGVELFFSVRTESQNRTRFQINNDIEIYRDGELLATTDGIASFVDSSAVDGQEYEYMLRVVHALGQVGEFSNAIQIATTAAGTGDVLLPVPTTTRPNRPAGLRAEIYFFDVELFWDRNFSGNVEAYEIRKDGELVAVTRGTSWYDDTSVSGDNPQYDVLAVGRDNQLLGIDSVSVQIGPAICQ